jgi:hypothetical protein
METLKITEYNDRKRACPVCGVYSMPSEEDSYHICEVCGWEDDGIQNDDPTYPGGANELCLKDYKNQWQHEHSRYYHKAA